MIYLGFDDGVVYLYSACGLFPLPIPRTAKATYVNKIKSKFRFLGKFMAKALMDSRMVRQYWFKVFCSIGFCNILFDCNVEFVYIFCSVCAEFLLYWIAMWAKMPL